MCVFPSFIYLHAFHHKPRPTLFGELTEDVSNHEYLALRVRARGHPRTRNSYFVNLQTDGPITTDLWQHRMFFRRDDGGWEDIFVRREASCLTVQLTMILDPVQRLRLDERGRARASSSPDVPRTYPDYWYLVARWE